MKMKIGFAIGMVLILLVSGCSRGGDDVATPNPKATAAYETAQAYLAVMPEDIPIHPESVDLKFAANNTYISYQVLGTVDEIVEYYRTTLEELGWEKRNNSGEDIIGGALTMLRSKPDKNISVTVQSIPESDNVRVLISIVPRNN